MRVRVSTDLMGYGYGSGGQAHLSRMSLALGLGGGGGGGGGVWVGLVMGRVMGVTHYHPHLSLRLFAHQVKLFTSPNITHHTEMNTDTHRYNIS